MAMVMYGFITGEGSALSVLSFLLYQVSNVSKIVELANEVHISVDFFHH